MAAMDFDKGKIPYNSRKKGTFIVKVDYCENETWQGRVTWAEENKTEHFRSALELIKLIDGATHGQLSLKLDKDKEDEGTA